MIKKRYVTDTGPQPTSMIKKRYVTDMGTNLPFRCLDVREAPRGHVATPSIINESPD